MITYLFLNIQSNNKAALHHLDKECPDFAEKFIAFNFNKNVLFIGCIKIFVDIRIFKRKRNFIIIILVKLF